MAKALTEARSELNANAPQIVTLKIPVDKIRDVIGTGGKVIREITETTGVKMDVEDDGTIRVAATSTESIDAAVKWIKDLTDEPEKGKVYDGKVVKTENVPARIMPAEVTTPPVIPTAVAMPF